MLVPLGQAGQLVCPVLAWYVPRGHDAQADDPVEVSKVPALQSRHALAPGTGA